ncbi:MAG: PKD domain-containing protein [Geobacter sp.]|nr:PKD domain-containing protein [Geobacter sp.]
MKSSFTRYFMVPVVLLLLALSGCGSGGDGQSTASTVSGTQVSPTAQDVAMVKAINDSVASLDANAAALAKVALPAAPVAGEQKVFGKSIFVVPKSGTLAVSKSFAGLVDGAQGTLVFYNSFGKDIPTTPCVGTAKQIKVCEASRAIALAWNPTSVEVILNGQTVIAPNQIPRTQGKALIPVTVNLADTLQINLAGPKYSFIQLEVWSMPTAPVVLNPVAEFTFSPTSGSVPLSVLFDASASSSPNGAITNYSWDFGDGSTATGMNVSHVYQTPGTYGITLTVTDSATKSATKSAQLVATFPQDPVASFSYIVDISTGAIVVTADGSSSSSPNGTIVSYTWDWGDASPQDFGVVATHTYSTSGTYSLALTIMDSAGLTNTMVQTITVP